MTIDDEVRVFEPVVHEDERGSFYESYNQTVFSEWLGREVVFVQNNHSISAQGVLRGLHYQHPPGAQANLVRVTRGAVYDVVVEVMRLNLPLSHDGSASYSRPDLSSHVQKT
jgi:dTDP-4-dehydrorhamnose 3,5-epimerase